MNAGSRVCTLQDEKPGKIEDITLDGKIERSKDTPGLDKDHWPNKAGATWNSAVDSCGAR